MGVGVNWGRLNNESKIAQVCDVFASWRQAIFWTSQEEMSIKAVNKLKYPCV